MAAIRRRQLGLIVVVTVCLVLLFHLHSFSSKTSSWTDSSSRASEDTGSGNAALRVWEVKGSLNHEVTAEVPIPILSKKSFDKLPLWDFEDVYNEDASPRPTTCVQTLRNSKDELFQKKFLPNVRLYLHKDNINVSEWNRLSHFNNPFGFMEYKYDEVMPSLKLIPKPKEPLLTPRLGGDGCVHCAVVGGGGILYGSKAGKEIDAHDYVFRVNGALTRGFEEDVGSRTSVYVHTAYSLTSSVFMLRDQGFTAAPHDEDIKYVLIPEQLNDFQWLPALIKGERVPSGPFQDEWPRTYYSGQYNESCFYVLHQDFLRYVRNRFLKSESLNSSSWDIVRPTSGAFTLFLALHTCDTVSVYGFMTDHHEKYSNYYVEKDEKTKVTFFKKHDYILEKNTWKWLHDSEIIQLYQRTEADPRT
ncbi:unnamed protein product [Ophioblennius macclurei]